MSYAGDYAVGAAVTFTFNTFGSNRAPIAPSSAFASDGSDFRIYKHKAGVTTSKATTNGITVTSPVDSEPGNHRINIDTSNNTGDANFWEAGCSYSIHANTAKTVDSLSIDGAKLFWFSMENRYAVTAVAIRDAILNRVLSGNHETAGSAGKVLQFLDALVSTAGPTASAIADAVWDEVQSGHTTNGTFGKYVDAAISSISAGSGVNEATVRAIIAEVLPPGTRYPAGQVGRNLPTQRSGFDFEIGPVTFGELATGEWTRIVFTIKDPSQAEADDEKALIQVIRTPSSNDWEGLRILSGKNVFTDQKALANIEITNASTGTAYITIKAAATKLLAANPACIWDTKRVLTDGSVPMVSDAGQIPIVRGVTKGIGA